MTTVTLTPNGGGYAAGGGFTNVGGAASPQAALADALDTTYIETPVATYAGANVTFTTTALPAGSRVVFVHPQVRMGPSPATPGGTFIAQLYSAPPAATQLEAYNVALATGIGNYGLTAQTLDYTGNYYTQAQVDSFELLLSLTPPAGATARWYQAYITLTYAVIPVVLGTAPSSPVSTTTKPTVTWTWTPDPLFTTQERYHVRVFTAAQYGIGGFDPETSPCTWDSTETLSAATSIQVGTHLTNGVTYRAYIRAGAQVNGSTHWSLWDDIQWTMSLTQPGVPTMTVTAQSAQARIKIDLDDNAGAAGTDWFRVERSDDGGTTWTEIRGGDPITPAAGLATVYDYETGNGQSVQYRSQAVSTDIGPEVASAFSTTSASAWSHPSWWLKCPTDPALNIQVRFAQDGIPRLSRRRPRAVLDILSRADPIVVSDTRRTVEGTMTLLTLDAAERVLIGGLLEGDATLLLQAPPAAEFGSRYIDIGDADESRVGGLDIEPTRTHDIPFVEVAAP